MPLQRPDEVKGRAPSGRAHRHAKPGFKEPITLILGQAPRHIIFRRIFPLPFWRIPLKMKELVYFSRYDIVM
jgi:hypothetical protein